VINKPTTIELDQFRDEMYQSIPLTQAMGLQYQSFEFAPARLITTLPFGPNVNDKDTAFGGSIAALATFSGWSLATLLCRSQDLHCDIVVFKSELEFLKPINANFYSLSQLEDEQREEFIKQLQERGKARLSIEVEIKQDNVVAACYRGDYAAKIVTKQLTSESRHNGVGK